jgi:hypothetical protein
MRTTLCSVIVLILALPAGLNGQPQPPNTNSLPPQLKVLGDQLLDPTRPEAARIDAALDLAEDTAPATIAFLASTRLRQADTLPKSACSAPASRR